MKRKKWNKWFLSLDAVDEEMQEFMTEWRKERKEHGDFVPAHVLYNTTAVLRELEQRGYLRSDGAGFAPK